jgi:hypothetical protein
MTSSSFSSKERDMEDEVFNETRDCSKISINQFVKDGTVK